MQKHAKEKKYRRGNVLSSSSMGLNVSLYIDDDDDDDDLIVIEQKWRKQRKTNMLKPEINLGVFAFSLSLLSRSFSLFLANSIFQQ